MTLIEALNAAEAVLGRELTADEIALVGQLVHTGSDVADVMTMLDGLVREPDLSDEDITTNRYEATGTHVRPIP